MKKFSLYLALVMAALMLVACAASPAAAPNASEAAAPGESAVAPEKYTIAVSVGRLSNPFYGRAAEILQKYAQELGNVDLILLDANDSSATQMEQLETMITKKVDGVLMAPVDVDALIPTSEALAEAGLPLVTVDEQLSGGAYLAHVGGNNVVGGQLAAEYIEKKFGDTENVKVAMLLGTMGASSTLLRQEGFHEVIDQYANYTVIEQTANFLRSEGLDVMDNILQANPDIKAVFTHNEEMGLGAIQALNARGYKPGDVTVVAFDTHLETLAELESGWLQGNIEQFPDEQFRKGLDVLLAYVADGTKPESQVIYLTPEVITAENIADSEKYADYLASK